MKYRELIKQSIQRTFQSQFMLLCPNLRLNNVNYCKETKS